jgi:hypothetical protein
VFYRVYSDNDIKMIRNPEFLEDPFLGSVLLVRIPPPHSVAAIKRYLCAREYIQVDSARVVLFRHMGCLDPLEDSELVDLVGVGHTPEEPIALVIKAVSDMGLCMLIFYLYFAN